MFALLPKNKVRKSAMTRGFMINLKLKLWLMKDATRYRSNP